MSGDETFPGPEHYETLLGPLRQADLDLGAAAAADAAPAAAVDQPPVPHTWREAWRLECEARYLMRKPMEARKAHYAGVLEKRGEAARNELIAEVNRQWALANPL